MANNTEREAATTTNSDRSGGKSGPTPKRRVAEAANQRPLVGDRSKEAKIAARAKTREQQAKAREGLARGDDRYLQPRERGPQKRFLRDTLDARLSVGEWLLPLMFVVIFATMLPNSQASVWALAFIWIYLAIAILESVLIAFSVRKKIAAVIGADHLEKGFVLQSLTRNMQLRVLRMPKPQVKRFQKVEFTGR